MTDSTLGNSDSIGTALRLVGELLAARGHRLRIVIIGGAAVNLLGLVTRATTDVDILAFALEDPSGTLRITPPDVPLPAMLVEASQTVARDLGLDPNWLNAGPASQWRTGLPQGLEQRLSWLDFGGLVVGIVGRIDLIYFKLYAAADHRGPDSVHFQDLVALSPNDEELEAAARWVEGQDASPEFATTIPKVIAHVRRHTARRR